MEYINNTTYPHQEAQLEVMQCLQQAFDRSEWAAEAEELLRSIQYLEELGWEKLPHRV